MSIEELLREQSIRDDVDEKLCDSHIGRRCMFIVLNESKDKIFRFSSTLEGIGNQWDTVLKNYTEVILLSEPIEIVSSFHCKNLNVSKVMGSHIVWVQTGNILPID